MDKKTLDAYSKLNLYQKKDMLELLLGNDVIIWSPETQQVDCAEDLFDVEDICLNGSSIQVTFTNIQAIVDSMAYRQA
tara:strand:- start:209 stop:442 length:234 start_codon:yes stop_codon:yes gene_type:complete